MTARWTLLVCLAAALALLAIGEYVKTDSVASDHVPASASSGRLDLVYTDPERGRAVFAERYDERDHGGHRQSWGAVQVDDGRVYVANSSGVLEYDGVAWRLIPTTLGLIRMVARLNDGRTVAVGEGGMGVLRDRPGAAATVEELVPSGSLDGEEVWGVFDADGAVVLQTLNRLARIEGGRIVSTLFAPEGRRFHKAFDVTGRLIVREEGVGLAEYIDGALRPLPDGGAFAETPVRALLDVDGQPGGRLLAVTNDAFFHLDGGAEPVPVPSPASDVLREGRAYHGCRVGNAPDALFAITTIGRGALIVDAQGALVQHFGTDVGLTPDDLVLGCTVDAQGGLWLPLSDGIARIDVASPLSIFDAGQGLPGAVYSLARHDGRLYAATERGVFRQTRGAPGQPARFEPVAPDQSMDQAWALASTPDGLLVGSTGGVYAVDGLSARRIMDGPAYTFMEDGAGRMLAGLKAGIGVLESDGDWRSAGLLPVATGEVRSMSASEGSIWSVERDGRLLRIDGDRVEAFGVAEGMIEGAVHSLMVDGRLMLLSPETIYEVRTDRLGTEAAIRVDGPLTRLAREAAGDTSEAAYYSMLNDESGRVWISGGARTLAVERRGGEWVDVTPAPFRTVTGILPVLAGGGVTYVGTPDGLYRLDGEGARYDIGGAALVRSLEAEDAGELLGGGTQEAPYGQALRFAFALPAFNDAPGTQYRSFLDGFDRRPNEWGGTRRREYTNLPPGDYTFRVEARTAQGATARPAAVAFRIPPPWYLTLWAIGGYALAAMLLVAGIAGLASHHERRKAAAAAARAAELAELNEQLREADRLKDDMLANTSHELRTPLTAIIGFSELLREYPGGDAAEVRELADHMFSGGRRLLRTVNDLLDIAQLRAGKLRLQPRDVDAAAVVRAVAAELRPLADEKALAFSVHPAGLVVPAHLDPDAFARVVINLLSNALKFTERGGVAVFVDASDGQLAVSVQDSGCGIAPDFLPRLFEEYVQESTGHGRRAEGSGLGLSITKGVVTLMGGTLDVASEVGTGTRVTVRLPLGVVAEAPSVEGSSVEAAPVEGTLTETPSSLPTFPAPDTALAATEPAEAG